MGSDGLRIGTEGNNLHVNWIAEPLTQKENVKAKWVHWLTPIHA